MDGLKAVKTIREYLLQHDIYTVGRFGEWAYYNTDHSILAGKRAVDAIKEKKRTSRTVSAPATIGAGASAGLTRTASARADQPAGSAGRLKS